MKRKRRHHHRRKKLNESPLSESSRQSSNRLRPLCGDGDSQASPSSAGPTSRLSHPVVSVRSLSRISRGNVSVGDAQSRLNFRSNAERLSPTGAAAKLVLQGSSSQPEPKSQALPPAQQSKAKPEKLRYYDPYASKFHPFKRLSL